MFSIDLLPAYHGDAIWVEYGAEKRTHKILIDCGPASTFPVLEKKIRALPESERHFELFVVSHVDDDHIGGALKLLEKSQELKVTFGDIWFNAFPHLEGKAIAADLLGAAQGERLHKLILESGHHFWNKAFNQKAVVCEKDSALPVVPLPGGMTLTLLSPGWPQLEKLKGVWIKVCQEANLIPGGEPKVDEVDDILGDDVALLAGLAFKADTAPANGSSIAFLAEYDDKAVLFGADAYAPVLLDSLTSLGYSENNKLALNALKLPHHGSSHNISQLLLQRLSADHVLVSTNGDRFKHPDKAALARVIMLNTPGATVHFNYKTKHNEFWGDSAMQIEHNYSAVFPDEGKEGIKIIL